MKHYCRISGKFRFLHEFSVWAIDNNFAYTEHYAGEYWGRRRSVKIHASILRRLTLSNSTSTIELITRDEMLLMVAMIAFSDRLTFEAM